jgi:hypothetical protein
MPMPKGTYYRVKTYASGKKVRLAISPDGRILEATPVVSKVTKTRTGKRLARRRRRIG